MVLRKILFRGSLLQSLFLCAEQLPLPFSYFENLYFEPKSSTFFTGAYEKNGRPIGGTSLFLFEARGTNAYLGHFFHLLEHILGLWSYYGDDHFQDVRLIVLGGERDGENEPAWEGPNQINRHLLKALFPQAEVKTWKGFLSDFRGDINCFERAVTSDRALSFGSPECAQINKMLGVARHSLSKEALQHLADKVHAYANTKFQSAPISRITYLKRSPPRALDPSIELKLLASIQTLGNFSLRIEDFTNLSFQEQINIIGNTDLLISVHGNGLSHLLFLPPSSRIIEIFPPSSHAVDYRLFADVRELHYTGVISDSGIISKEASYRLGPFGDVDKPIHELDISLILKMIEQ